MPAGIPPAERVAGRRGDGKTRDVKRLWEPEVGVPGRGGPLCPRVNPPGDPTAVLMGASPPTLPAAASLGTPAMPPVWSYPNGGR